MTRLRRHPRGGRFLAQALERLGIRHVISLPGSQMLAALDAIARTRMQLVVPRSEATGAMMANGYGLTASRPCVVMNTLGPGVGNELSGLHDAWLGGSPVVFVCPVHPPEKRDHLETVFQGFDQSAFLAPYAKHSHVIDAAEKLGETLELAVAQSIEPRMGPVRVDVSFPLLFERHAFGALPAAREDATPNHRTVVIAEATRDLAPYLDVGGAERLWPAAGDADDAVAFAVGAALAHDGATVLVTTVDVLTRNVHALSLPSGSMPPATLVSAEGSGAEALARLARNVGLQHRVWDEKASMRPEADHLTIIAVSGRGEAALE